MTLFSQESADQRDAPHIIPFVGEIALFHGKTAPEQSAQPGKGPEAKGQAPWTPPQAPW